MTKRNGARLSALASMVALMVVMGKAYAMAEDARHQARGNGGHSHRTRRGPGGFGGEKRAGVKLARKIMRYGMA